MDQHNLVNDGRFVDDGRVSMYLVRPGWRWEEESLLSPTDEESSV